MIQLGAFKNICFYTWLFRLTKKCVVTCFWIDDIYSAIYQHDRVDHYMFQFRKCWLNFEGKSGSTSASPIWVDVYTSDFFETKLYIHKVKRYKAMWVQLYNIDLAFRNTASRHTHPSYVPGPCQKARRLAWQYSRGAPWLLNDGSCGGGRDDLKNIGV